MLRRRRTLLGLAGVLVLAVAAGAGPAAGTPETARYRVTLTNLTDSQPFSPPVAATHRKSVRMFQVGRLASDELAAIAQNGDPGPMFDLFSGAKHVTEAVNVGRPLTRHGTTVGPFTDSATFEIEAVPGDRFSIATMLICTNDGILGLDAVKLPKSGSKAFMLNGYDAGRERNDELSQDIVDPCSLLGPVALPGDPDGNVDTGSVLTIPAQSIAHHPGISGIGELSPTLHDWSDPVAQVVIERVG
jgi:hypothetical protein